jgi:hypothetical protein
MGPTSRVDPRPRAEVTAGARPRMHTRRAISLWRRTAGAARAMRYTLRGALFYGSPTSRQRGAVEMCVQLVVFPVICVVRILRYCAWRSVTQKRSARVWPFTATAAAATASAASTLGISMS